MPAVIVEAAIVAKETQLGGALTAGQAAAVRGICRGGRRVSLVLGVAGAGKTTALDCVRAAYQAAGYTVIGTATSGQAARTLGREAGIGDSRTLASLLWRLDHDQLTLTDRHVIFLDEAGMTDDPDLLRLLVAAEVARSTVVLVGDDHQLSPVGPGGALGALIGRHGGVVHVLSENVRQVDQAERWALSELRDGDVERAVSWYGRHGRIALSPNRDAAIEAVAEAWLADALAGRDVGMYAWRRANVEALNQAARARWDAVGQLTGPELEAPGGRRYRAGDRIVTLAPGRDGHLVTSERGVITGVDPASGTMAARMDDGRLQRLTAEETTRERLAYGYAVTVHRSQGATVDVAHHYADGGGRELGYVAMSRARQRTTVHMVADDIDQAIEDLRRDWSTERRARWAIDTGTPGTQHPGRVGSLHATPAVRRAALQAERDALAALVPPDRRAELARLDHSLREMHHERDALAAGRLHWWHSGELRAAAEALRTATSRRAEAERVLTGGHLHWRQRRQWRVELEVRQQRERDAAAEYERLVQPERARLDAEIAEVATESRALCTDVADHDRWHLEHPDAAPRLRHLDTQLDRLTVTEPRREHLTRALEQAIEPPTPTPEVHVQRVEQGIDLGMDLGL